MRVKLSSCSGSSLVVSSLFGALGMLVTGCGGDEPVSNTGNADPTSTGADESDETGANSDDEQTQEDNGTQSTATPTTTTTTTTTDSESTAPVVPLGTVIGIACSEDGDCASPLTCVRSDDSFRGTLPGSGVCTMPCTADTECEALDGLGFCGLLGAPTDEALAAAGEGEVPEGFATFCMQLCPFGLAAYKCDSSANSACYPLTEEVTTTTSGSDFQIGVCSPICESDTECQSGEHCDKFWGMCVEDEREGKGLGESCDWSAETAECAGGLCLAISEDPPSGICSEPCNFHPDTIACGATAGPDAEFGCFWNMYASVNSSLNDVGQCVPLCDADPDCGDGLVCVTDVIQDQVGLYGRAGLCFPGQAATGDAGAGMSTEPVPADTSEPQEPPAGADAGNGSRDGG